MKRENLLMFLLCFRDGNYFKIYSNNRKTSLPWYWLSEITRKFRFVKNFMLKDACNMFLISNSPFSFTWRWLFVKFSRGKISENYEGKCENLILMLDSCELSKQKTQPARLLQNLFSDCRDVSGLFVFIHEQWF